MKKVHIISVGNKQMSELAIVLKMKGCEITCSGVNIMDPERAKLAEHEIEIEQDGWFPEKLNKDIDFVIAGNDLSVDNPELEKAKELNLLILSYPEYIFSKIKTKLRLLIAGNSQKRELSNMVLYALKKNNLLCDYVVEESIDKTPSVNFSYDTRIAVLEDSCPLHTLFLKRQINEYYRPHILVIPDMNWVPSKEMPSKDDYNNSLKNLINSVERDGKVIYNDNCQELVDLVGNIREDMTAMPYSAHTVKEDESGTYLVSRFGEFMVYRNDPSFLENINAARLACRQMGLSDKHFLETMVSYSQL